VELGLQLRPELVFRRSDAVIAIADTKWKLVGCDSKSRLMSSEADTYQMHAYASTFQCSELALIYPWRGGLAQVTGAEFGCSGKWSRSGRGCALL
jgi:5-methylcytosine-specific restriction endonuclease McrBC regulatory subunit McrC